MIEIGTARRFLPQTRHLSCNPTIRPYYETSLFLSTVQGQIERNGRKNLFPLSYELGSSACPLKKSIWNNGLLLDLNSMHSQSLSVASLGYTSVSCVGRYTDLVECVLIPEAVCGDHLTWIPESRHSCRACQDGHSRASGGRPPKS